MRRLADATGRGRQSPLKGRSAYIIWWGEQIKKIVIAERELTVEAGDLTPSMKCVARWSSRGLPIAFRVFTNEVGVLRRRSEWRRLVDASVR